MKLQPLFHYAYFISINFYDKTKTPGSYYNGSDFLSEKMMASATPIWKFDIYIKKKATCTMYHSLNGIRSFTQSRELTNSFVKYSPWRSSDFLGLVHSNSSISRRRRWNPSPRLRRICWSWRGVSIRSSEACRRTWNWRGEEAPTRNRTRTRRWPVAEPGWEYMWVMIIFIQMYRAELATGVFQQVGNLF